MTGLPEDKIGDKPQPSKPLKATFEAYKDPTGEFESSTLKYGVWFVEHRLGLYRLLVGFLIGTSVILFAIAAIAGYLELMVTLNDKGAFNQALRSFPDYTLVQTHFAPQPLQIIEATVFSGGVDKYDLVAQVTNPNTRFTVGFDYSFAINGQQTPLQHTVLLAGENRPVATLGLADTSYPSAPQLILSNVQWQRIPSHRIGDPVAWQTERLNFSASEFAFKDRSDQDGANAATVSFMLTNSSPYGYASPHFYVGFYNQDSLVGIAPLQIQNFPSLAARKVDIRSFAPTISVSEVRVFPLIDVYDQAVFLSAK